MRERREAAEFKGAGAQPHEAPVPQLGQPGDRSVAAGLRRHDRRRGPG